MSSSGTGPSLGWKASEPGTKPSGGGGGVPGHLGEDRLDVRGAFRRGHVVGGVDEPAELGVRDLVLIDPEAADSEAMGGPLVGPPLSARMVR